MNSVKEFAIYFHISVDWNKTAQASQIPHSHVWAPVIVQSFLCFKTCGMWVFKKHTAPYFVLHWQIQRYAFVHLQHI